MCICAAPITPLEGVTIYGSSNSRDFHQVRSFFENRGVIFDHANTEQDSTHRTRMVELSGQDQAVVVEIGKKIFVGFDSAALEATLP